MVRTILWVINFVFLSSQIFSNTAAAESLTSQQRSILLQDRKIMIERGYDQPVIPTAAEVFVYGWMIGVNPADFEVNPNIVSKR